MTRPEPTTDPQVRAQLNQGQRVAAANKAARTRATIIAIIERFGPDGAQAVTIARRSGLSRSTVIRTLNALVAAGQASRRFSPTDARVILYRLTEGA